MTRGWTTIEPRFVDGPGARARIGLLVLATDLAIEQDVSRFAAIDGVDVVVSRMPMSTRVTKETLAALEHEVVAATERLVSWASFDAIAFGCTSGAIAVGAETLETMIRSVKPGVAVCNPIDAALEALDVLACRRVALLTPYVAEVNKTLEAYFDDRGLLLAGRAGFGQAGDPEINRIDPECIVEAALALDSDDADGLFISCTGLCTAGIVQRVEDLLAKPVVTSNQALTWSAMRSSGIKDPVNGFGQLLAKH